ncbi:hypothetical protein JW905_18655 [bacterium]|nr:hypothetical protein [candidate division CSSED10-310 bacterium]
MRRHALLLTTASLLAMVTVAGSLLFFGMKGIGTRPLQEDEKTLLISIDDLAAYFDPIPGDRRLCERSVAKRNMDGCLELEYSYDTDRDPGAEHFLYLSSEAELWKSEAAAAESCRERIAAYKTGIKIRSGRTFRETPELFSLGEGSWVAMVFQGDRPVGNIVVTRQSGTVHSLIVYGLVFDERDLLEALFQPLVRAGAAPRS